MARRKISIDDRIEQQKLVVQIPAHLTTHSAKS